MRATPLLLSLALALAAVACGRERASQPPTPSEPSASEAPPAASSTSTGAPASPWPATAPPEAALHYVGSEACGACHARELARWRGSHHAKAMQVAADGTVLGDFGGARFAKPGVESRFTRADGRFVIRTDGPDGALADFDAAYTFGVDPLQQLLVSFPGGRLQATSLAWDARPRKQGGARWFDLHGDERVAPGDPLHWTSLAGSWNAMCAECHSTDLRKGWIAAEARYDTRWAELSVGCEACHGPGSAHVSRARDGAARVSSGREAASGLVVPLGVDRAVWSFAPGERIARRSAPAPHARPELDACGRCHARRAPLTDAYTPGRSLLDTHRPALLEADLYFDDGQIRDEVYEWGSFLQSRMHAAGVTCSDCHDVHAATLRADGNAVCAACHATAAFDTKAHHHHAPGSKAARCTSCHMPERVYMTVDARHDHSLRVPRPELEAEVGAPDVCTGCHNGRPTSWAVSAIAAWRVPGAPAPRAHFAEALHASRAGAANADAALAALAADAAQPAIARATAVAELAGWSGARASSAIAQAARSDEPLLRFAAAESLASLEPPERVGAGAALLRDPLRAVRLAAAPSLATTPATLWSPSQRDDLSRALAEVRASHEANADRPESLVSLGALHATLGEAAEARASYESAIRLAPWFVPAYVNLADLARSEGDDAQGESLLEKALALAPESADVHHALGLLRVRQDRLDDAIAELRRAAELAPGNARYAVVHAIALQEAGRTDDALRALDAAHRARPGEREVLATLATLARDAGQLERARDAARALVALAPDDPRAAALARELEAPSPEAPADGADAAPRRAPEAAPGSP